MKKEEGSIILSAILSLVIIYSCFYILNTSIQSIKMLKLREEMIKSVEADNNKLKEIECLMIDNFNKSKATQKDEFTKQFCKKDLYKRLTTKKFKLYLSKDTQKLQKKTYTHYLTSFKLKLFNPKFNRISSSKYIFTYVIGNLPYDIIPLTLNKKKPENISVNSPINNCSSKIENNTEKLEKEIKNIEQTLFKISCKNTSWKKLRKIAGLEIIESPINEGIYINEKERSIKNIFVQGDVEEIIFFVDEENRENILIKNKADSFHIRYKNKNDITFTTKDSLQYEKFEEKIYVNGNVKSINSQDKKFAFNKESSIYLYVKGFVSIKNSLRNIPSSKANHFTLICDQKGMSLRIKGKKKSTIAANIISKGDLECKNIKGNKIIGSLQCNNIKVKKHLQIQHQRNREELLCSKDKELAKLCCHRIYLGEISYGKPQE